MKRYQVVRKALALRRRSVEVSLAPHEQPDISIFLFVSLFVFTSRSTDFQQTLRKLLIVMLTMRLVTVVGLLVYCQGISGAAGGNNVSGETIAELFQTRPGDPSSARFLTQLCRQESATEHRRRQAEGQCSSGDLSMAVYCYVEDVMQRKFLQCARKQTYPCPVIFIGAAYTFWVKASVIQDAAPKSIQFPLCSDQNQLDIGRDIIYKCGLTRDHRECADQGTHGGGGGEARYHPTSVMLLLRSVGRLWLLLASHQPHRALWDKGGRYHYGCWEPVLAAAGRLLDAPGRWEVNDACVDTLEALCTAVLRYLAPQTVTFVYDGVKPSGLLRAFGDISVKLAQGATSALLQTVIYPAFREFKQLAKIRNQPHGISGHAIVSCSGLRGRRREVFDTALRLLRMVGLNHVRMETYNIRSAMIVSVFSSVLPCTMPSVI